MSGIAGILVPAGRSVDPRLLRRMTASLTGRGPDGQYTWSSGRVGFAHTLLRTRDDSEATQPLTLDGSAWITADARIDGRAELLDELRQAGQGRIARTSDAQLILHAYHAWGERCVDHLLGDFAFAIWDERTQRLFCARDHLGVKPLYYAQIDDEFVFSNTLNCVRLHPGVERTLNELSIADFLLFGYSLDPGATSFASVHRVPPAHVLVAGANAPLLRRYWTPPTDGCIRYRRSRDYVEHFEQLFRTAVADRVTDAAPSVWLSGGLDSSAIAVTARHVLCERGEPFNLSAHTVVYDTLIPDEERHYAMLGAREVGVAPRFWVGDEAAPFAGWEDSAVHTPEPIDDPYHGFHAQQLQEMAGASRVALSGDGSDELLTASYALDLVGRLSPWQLAIAVARSLQHRRRPAAGIRAALKSNTPPSAPELPRWLDADLAAQHGLRERVREWASPSAETIHWMRPEAYRRLFSPAWPAYLESADPGVTGVPVEHRWPFLDVRLIEFALAIPPLPWCVDKHLLRSAMRTSLPTALVQRKKTPLGGDPLSAHLQHGDWSWLDRFSAVPQLARYVDRARIPPLSAAAGSEDVWTDVRPFCLNSWLSRETMDEV
jgi:asparagine synthase (glutamine-hydrolysing)